MGRRWAAVRVAAALALAVLGALWGWRAGQARAARPADYSGYDPAQLSWVQEGIQERIAALEQELETVREIQRDAN